MELVCRLASSCAGTARIEHVEVLSQGEADRLRFLGSPTVQVNELDIEPEARARTDFAMTCRLYGSSGTPPADMVLSAICEAMQ